MVDQSNERPFFSCHLAMNAIFIFRKSVKEIASSLQGWQPTSHNSPRSISNVIAMLLPARKRSISLLYLGKCCARSSHLWKFSSQWSGDTWTASLAEDRLSWTGWSWSISLRDWGASSLPDVVFLWCWSCHPGFNHTQSTPILQLSCLQTVWQTFTIIWTLRIREFAQR